MLNLCPMGMVREILPRASSVLSAEHYWTRLWSRDYGRRALSEYPEVARVESQAVCRQYFLGASFKFADLAPH